MASQVQRRPGNRAWLGYVLLPPPISPITTACVLSQGLDVDAVLLRPTSGVSATPDGSRTTRRWVPSRGGDRPCEVHDRHALAVMNAAGVSQPQHGESRRCVISRVTPTQSRRVQRMRSPPDLVTPPKASAAWRVSPQPRCGRRSMTDDRGPKLTSADRTPSPARVVRAVPVQVCLTALPVPTRPATGIHTD